MPDNFETLFADLRAATLPQIRPPGIEAARRTALHRRRTTRTVAVAAVVLAVVGGLAATSLPWRGGPEVEYPVDAAQRAVDTQLPNLTGQVVTSLVTDDEEFTFPDLTAGTYTLALACSGPGVVTIEAALTRAGRKSGGLGGQVASCAAAPQVAVLVFRLPVKGSVVVTTAGDIAATGSARYALKLGDDGTGGTLPSSEAPVSPESAWNAARAADVLRAHGRPGSHQLTTEDGTTQVIGPGKETTPGDYDFVLVCAGSGSLTLTVRTVRVSDGVLDDAGPALVTEEVKCLDVDPRLDETGPLTLPADSTFSISADPDQQARNRAGLAYDLIRR